MHRREPVTRSHGHEEPQDPRPSASGSYWQFQPPQYSGVNRSNWGTDMQPSPMSTQRQPVKTQNLSSHHLEDDNLGKAIQFFNALLSLSKASSIHETAKDLIQQLVDGKIDPEIFARRLQDELNSGPQPQLAPLLKASICDFRNALAFGNVRIEGIRAAPQEVSLRQFNTPIGATDRELLRKPEWGLNASNALPKYRLGEDLEEKLLGPVVPEAGTRLPPQQAPKDFPKLSGLTRSYPTAQLHPQTSPESTPKSVSLAIKVETASTGDQWLLKTASPPLLKRPAGNPAASFFQDFKRTKIADDTNFGDRSDPTTDAVAAYAEELIALQLPAENADAMPTISPENETVTEQASTAAVPSAAVSVNVAVDVGSSRILQQIRCLVSYGRHIFSVDLFEDKTIGDLKEQCHGLTGLPVSQMGIVSCHMPNPAVLSDQILMASLNLRPESTFILFATNRQRWFGVNAMTTCRVVAVNGSNGEEHVVYVNRAQTVQEFKSHAANLMQVSVDRQKWSGVLKDVSNEQLWGNIGLDDANCNLTLTTLPPHDLEKLQTP